MIPLLVAGLVVAGTVGATVVIAEQYETARADRAVVERVVDGDTLDVERDGTVERIRLLNIDTPETVDPARPVECLGPEASVFLKGLLPAGTTVTLEYDEERTDRYGRTLAAVFTSDGTLVNAEIARQGMAEAVVIEPNRRFYPQVELARDEAIAAARGLFSSSVACTVPAQVQAVSNATAGIPAVDPQATPAQLDAGVTAAAGAVVSAVALEQSLGDGRPGIPWSALPVGEQRRLLAQVVAAREKAQRDETAGRDAATAAREQEAVRAEQDRRRAARQLAERQERERTEARAAAERTRVEQAAVEKPAPKPVERRPAPSQDRSSGSSAGGGPPGYTGPRCYAPGGKTWKPC